MSKKYSAVLFDVDGTLTSTNTLIFESFNFITTKYLNKTLTPQEIIGLFGPTEDQIIETWFPDNYELVKTDYFAFYQDKHQELASRFPGIRSILQDLDERGIILGAFTGKGRKTARITLNETGLAQYFQLLISGDDVQIPKPHHNGIEIFLKHFGLNPEEVLMVGDAPADIQASRGAGVDICAVLWDSYAREKVIGMQPDYICHTTGELAILLENHITAR